LIQVCALKCHFDTWMPILELTAMSRRVTLRVHPPIPFGDVTIMPSPLTGRPEADMARAMAAALADVEAPTAAEVYNRLRQAFPLAPLSARVGALANLMDFLRRPGH
jgi:hypothetical protein